MAYQVAFQQADFTGWNLWAAINDRPLLPFRSLTSLVPFMPKIFYGSICSYRNAVPLLVISMHVVALTSPSSQQIIMVLLDIGGCNKLASVAR